MRAKEFFEKFVEKVLDDGKYPDCNQSEREFTDKINTALRDIQSKDYPEYYKIDHTYFEDFKDDNSRKLGLNPSKWILKALVEHENKTNDWNYEVYKLAPFKCPLRVVIGYVEKDQREKDLEKLSIVADNLHYMEDNDCFCSEGEFLVILGNDGWDEPNYKAYVYDNGEFIEL